MPSTSSPVPPAPQPRRTKGGSGGGLDVTALLATANDDGQTHAFFGAGLKSAIHAGSLNVEADGSLSSDSLSLALGIALITVSDASSTSTVGSNDPTEQTVAAFIELAPGSNPAPSTATITSPGAILVKAHETPQASAAATGVGAGAVSVDAVKSACERLRDNHGHTRRRNLVCHPLADS